MMTTSTSEFDAVVVGAGTAGANVAYQMARRGLTVAMVDRRSLDAAGAQWHNGVLDWQFARAGLEPPAPPERSATVPRLHLVDRDGRVALRLESPPTVGADMAALGTRLRSLGTDHGVVVFEDVGEVVPVVADGRVRAIEFGVTGGDGGAPATRLEAALFVDASGRHGVLRRVSPALAPWCPPVRSDELCSASDFRFRVSDRNAASGFLSRHGAAPGEAVTAVGVAGGFSTCAVTISSDLDTVGVLVGCLANGRYGTGPSMLRDLRAREPWIGDVIGGGSGVIPLRRPYARFTAPGLALVGDAACQVFPAHGSGIGIGLIAGSMLAETVASGGRTDVGDESLLWRYQHDFMREFGGLLASYDVVRRMSTALDSEGTTALLGAGVMSDTLTRAGLDQRSATPLIRDLPRMIGGLASRPRLAEKVLPYLTRSRTAAMLGARTPLEADLAVLSRWDRRMRAILGPLPG